MVLYGSEEEQPGTETLYVANRGRYPWNSRVFNGRACCGYLTNIWRFYAPSRLLVGFVLRLRMKMFALKKTQINRKN